MNIVRGGLLRIFPLLIVSVIEFPECACDHVWLPWAGMQLVRPQISIGTHLTVSTIEHGINAICNGELVKLVASVCICGRSCVTTYSNVSKWGFV